MEEGKAKLMTLADVNAFVNAYDAESEKKRRLLGIGCTYRVAVPSVALLTEIARVTDSGCNPLALKDICQSDTEGSRSITSLGGMQHEQRS